MYIVNLELATWKASHILRRNLYTFEDRVLFGSISDFGALKYSSGLWEAWVQIRVALRLFLGYSLGRPHWRGDGGWMRWLGSCRSAQVSLLGLGGSGKCAGQDRYS